MTPAEFPRLRQQSTAKSEIRVLAMMEGSHVTGPAKILIQMARYGLYDPDRNGAPRLNLIPVIFTRADFRPEPLVEALKKAELPFEVIHERRRFDPDVFAQLRELVRRYNPHAVESHMVKSHFMVRYSGVGKMTRWVAFHHGYTKVDWKVRIYNEFDRWSLSAADHIISVCGPFAQELKSRGIDVDRISIQHNSIEPWKKPAQEELDALRARFGIDGKTPVLLAVGRLSFEKGFADLIEAAGLLRSKQGAFRLFIVGEGPERPRLQEAIDRLDLASHVVLAGHTNRIAPWYAVADMMTISSHSEGSPNMLLEGMAAGLPIVATRAGGIPEIVTDNVDALIVPPRDPVQMSEAVQSLLQNPARAAALGQAALHSSHERFSVAARYASLAAVFEQVVRTVDKGPRF